MVSSVQVEDPAEADAAAAQPGAIGALLRREGLYSSHLVTWRRERQAGMLKGLTPQKRRAHRDDDRSAEVRASALSKTPIGSVDPYALKIPARRAECLFTTLRQSVSTHRHRAFAVWLPLARQSGSLPRRP